VVLPTPPLRLINAVIIYTTKSILFFV